MNSSINMGIQAQVPSHLLPTYQPLPIALSHGQGAWVFDTHGKRYLDTMAGIAVSALGHTHPAIVSAIETQARRIIHTSNAVQIPQQIQLAQTICDLSGMDQVFFCNSGAEANEAAIKLARMYAHHRKITHPEIIVMEGAFHGRTMATLSASGSRKVQAGFEPLVQGFIRVPYNDVAAIEAVAASGRAVVAILVEPIQGEGGVILPDSGYLTQLKSLCKKHDWLLMFDEVQSGIGRTGRWFAFQHEADAKPDVMTLAKGLGGGIPIGACVVSGNACDLLRVGNHGSTFGGNPLSCHVAQAVLQTIETEHLCEHADNLGKQLLTGLQVRLSGLSQVKQVRGKGLWLGIELNRPCRDILEIGLQYGILLNITALSVIRLAPPLIFDETHVMELLEKLPCIIEAFG
jgi:acetylornithine aminotransferase